MKKTIFLTIAVVALIGVNATAQVKVGTNPTTINDDAILEMESTDKGMLFPRLDLTMTTAAAPLTAHVVGMTVYNTATAGTAPNNVTPGYYYNDGTKWVRLATYPEIDLRMLGNNNHITSDAGVGSNGTSAGTGSNNIMMGRLVGNSLTTGFSNVAIGSLAGWKLTEGTNNIMFGSSAGQYLTTAKDNVIIGNRAGRGLLSGENNIFIGELSGLQSGVDATENIMIGRDSGQKVDGNYNTFIGSSAGRHVVGNYNMIWGHGAGFNLATGNHNLLIGEDVGITLTSGNRNVVIGMEISVPVTTGSNQLNIANIIYGTNIDGTFNTLSSGNIGIGITNPSEKLDVVGNIKASGNLQSGTKTYPDYVFEEFVNGDSTINKNYSFKTLNEVEAFIKINKHLPGVTSIKELEKTEAGYSFNITELATQSLEKVEELFLHTIAQQKELDSKGDKIENLEKENEAKNLEIQALKSRLSKIEAALGLDKK